MQTPRGINVVQSALWLVLATSALLGCDGWWRGRSQERTRGIADVRAPLIEYCKSRVRAHLGSQALTFGEGEVDGEFEPSELWESYADTMDIHQAVTRHYFKCTPDADGTGASIEMLKKELR